MEVTQDSAGTAKTENMQYYHIAPSDLGRDISPALEEDEEDDDDPNWLMTGTKKSSYGGSRTNVMVRQADPPRNGSSNNNRLSRLIEGVATAIIGPTAEEEGEADVIVGESAKPLPAYYRDDPIAARICELFDEMEPLEKIFAAEDDNLAEDDVADVEAHPAVVKLRPKAAKGGGGIFGRKKQTVSGYFSDWTKWLRGPESASANEGSAKCNGRE